jgi:hypothetical protein
MLRRYSVELLLGAIFIALIAAVWVWQNPGAFGARVSQADIDRYVAILEKAPVPDPERATMIASAKTWLAADDGKPVYMLNLMRFYEELRRIPNGPTSGTPAEANERYESAAIPLLMQSGGYPRYAGTTQGGNLIEGRPELDNWDRVLLVRYPSRRVVMDMFTDPRFIAIVGNKLAALSVVLTPTSPELQIPELPWALAALLLPLWLAIGWFRATRKIRSGAQK